MLPRIRVSDNGHFLVTETGAPFFWLGDTAWELFHRCTREEVIAYFANRQAKGFTLIQAVVLAEFEGLTTPNAYGVLPLHENDPTRPRETYFAFVDTVIHLAAQHQLYVGLLPTWGDKVNRAWGAGPVIFNPDNAFTYGQMLGQRYREQSNIIWILGGDRLPVTDEADYRPIWRAMAAGIDAGTRGQALMAYHPPGGLDKGTSRFLHDEDWLDINMLQSGHGSGHDVPVWEQIAADYARVPTRPVLDAEPNYEDHPVNPWPAWNPANGYFRDYDVRKQCYRSVFAGGCGVTYGHHAVWQFYDPAKREPVNHADRSWQEALDRPGAAQVGFLRRLMESRPYFSRVPDQALLASDPGAGAQHVAATRDADGRYAFVYIPNASQSVEVRMDMLAGEQARAWWFDPRTGTARELGMVDTSGTHTFTTPAEGPDWVLVLDDSAQGFDAPGAA